MQIRGFWQGRLPRIAAPLLVVALFFALNYTAWDGFFQDDELDNISWAPALGARDYAPAFLKPTFDPSNFRPSGHLYFTLMGRAFGMDFPPYVTPIFAIHFLNAALLFLLLRRLSIPYWHALAATAFFALSAAAMDAYWKPMYVFDLVCTTFCLASILLWTHRRWVLSSIAFWLAYKAKELAVMLPLALAAYELLLGKRRILPLLPFFAASLSFGLQGILLNPNKDNEYTFRFTLDALRHTLPFYAHRFLGYRASGLALLALPLLPDRRVRWAIAAMAAFIFTLLFLPGRLYEAYAYLPLALTAVALAAAASRISPVWAWAAFALWMPFNVHQLRLEQKEKLARDDRAYAFVNKLQAWEAKHPAIRTLVYKGVPNGFHDWGVTAAWNIPHRAVGLKALWFDSPEAVKALADDIVAYAEWDNDANALTIQIHSPGK